ncbi:MAG TPA: sugar ABC transporter permease [Trebonia sp.]|nr:sugar ABC transporter permease [Trebonia sp.]
MTIKQPAGAGSTAVPEAGVPSWPKEDTAAGTPSGRRARRQLSPSARREQRWFYLLTSPWMIGFVLFGGGPVIASGVMSFTNWSILSSPHWAGLANYREMLHDSTFWTALWNTLYFGFGSVIVSLVLTFCMALLLNQRVRGLWFFRLVFYLPTVTSGIATALLWEVVLDPNYGLINRILAVFGIQGPGWLASTTWAMPALIIMSVWGAGNTIVIYLAGLQGVPPALYEAASIDGAGWWRRLCHVTLPMMSPVIFFNCVTGFIVTLQSYVLILVMTQGGPGNATMVLGLYIYREAFEYYNLGYASAMAWVMLVVILIITLVQFLVGRRFVHFESGRGEA